MSHRLAPGAVGYPPAAPGRMWLNWCGFCGGVVLFAGVLTALSEKFGHNREVGNMPIIEVVLLMAAAGLAFAIFLPVLLRHSEKSGNGGGILILIIVSGIAARLIFIASAPILENDYQRYLWDGAVVAAGENPYVHAPRDVIRDGEAGVLGRLSIEGAETLSRIGHKPLTTIYPPIAQALFAVANLIQPWSLTAWRALLLLCDAATLVLLIKFLDVLGRNRLWVALYWLNPLVLKEGFNSAHMEPALIPLVLGAVYLAWSGRTMGSTLVLALATGIKLWPAALAPLLWRRLVKVPSGLALNALAFLFLTAIWVAPLLYSAPMDNAGLKAYAVGWSTNSALYPAIEKLASAALTVAGIDAIQPSFVARVTVASVLCGLALLLARREWQSLEDLIRRTSLFVLALVLLSPAQYPWYAFWLAPFIVFWPHPAFLLLSATLPLYYLSFYLAARDAYDFFSDVVVWFIWCPVWLLLARSVLWRPVDVVPIGSALRSGS